MNRDKGDEGDKKKSSFHPYQSMATELNMR